MLQSKQIPQVQHIIDEGYIRRYNTTCITTFTSYFRDGDCFIVMWINFRKYKKRKLLIMAKVYDDINVKYRHKNYLPRFGFRFNRDIQLLWNTIMSMKFRRDTHPKQIYAYSIAILNTYPIITSYLLSNIFILIWYSWNTVFFILGYAYYRDSYLQMKTLPFQNDISHDAHSREAMANVYETGASSDPVIKWYHLKIINHGYYII